MTERELPRLSSADLHARYGDDEAALRRYRMLTALLREGRSASEVAQTFGVSRETLRRVRLAFDRRGVDGLRSQPRRSGHLMRGTPLARALRQELAADPGASDAALLHRVQAQLIELGIAAPRSSFYRLLGRLRAETVARQRSAPDTALREALSALAEDPPLALGRGDLAALLLPDVREPLMRGRWLQRVLRAAIERLRPAEAGPALDDMRWRHYLIIAGEYEAGNSRAELQNALALSASTYSRAKREAMGRLAALLHEAAAELPSPAPPATMTSPPAPPEACTHEPELERYMARLRRDGLVVIWGHRGTGKTALAATMAARLIDRGQTVVWHTVRPAEGEASTGQQLLLSLAAALDADGKHTLWTQLNSGEPAQFSRAVDMLSQSLSGRHWTLVIDSADMLHGAHASQLITVLRNARFRRDLRLVLVSRAIPDWVDSARWPPLAPPEDATTRRAMIALLDEQDGVEARPNDQRLALIRDRVGELLALTDLDILGELPLNQRAAIHSALQPLEPIIRQLQP